jgi:hypothetical protein
MRMTRQNKKTAEIVTATTAVAIAVCASRCVLTADAPAADTPPVQLHRRFRAYLRAPVSR